LEKNIEKKKKIRTATRRLRTEEDGEGDNPKKRGGGIEQHLK